MALLLALAAPAQLATAAPSAQVFIDNGELNYVGSLSEEANRQAFALFGGEQNKPAILSIRSPGGSTSAGLELGRWVHANGLTVKVMEYCFSSCANYVFTAAPRKVVSNFAVVGYHGGLSSTSFQLDDEQEAMLKAMPPDQARQLRAQLVEAILKEFAPQAEAERLFFSQIGVQQRITTLGQGQEARHDPKSIGWTYSVADFSTLGVKDIRVVNPPWRPAFVNSDKTVAMLDLDPANDAPKANHAATCAFIGDQVARLEAIVGKGTGRDTLLRVIPENGASLFRRQARDLRIDYLITAGGKTLLSRAELGRSQLGKTLSATSLQARLGLAQALPATFRTGCDRLYLSVKRQGPDITAMTIDVDID